MINISYKAKFILLNILFITSIICVFFFVVVQSKNTNLSDISLSNIKMKFDEREEILINSLKNGISIINSIDESIFLDKYLTSSNPYELNNFFKAIISMDTNIFQIRYIDVSGYEMVRVDKNPKTNDIVILPNEDLQYKGNRDYFQYFSTLNQNEVAMSNFDVNQEFDKLKDTATVRYGKVVYKNGVKRGILIVNVNVTDIFHTLAKSVLFNIFLIDKNGKFLLYKDEVITDKTLNIHFNQLDAKNILNNSSYHGKNFYSKLLPIKNYQDLRLVVEYKFEDKVKETDKLQKELILVGFVLILIYILLISVLAKIPDKLLERLQITSAKLQKSIYNETSIEKQYKALFETINDGIVIVDDKSEYILMYNKAFAEMIGYDKDVILNNNINIFYNAKESLLTLLKKQKNNEICLLDAIDLVTKCGSKIYVDVSISPLKLDDADYDIVIFRDISEKIKRDKEIKSKDKLLLQQSKMAAMGEMIGMIAHQWRQPLTAITAVIQAIDLRYKMDKLDEAFISSQVKTAKNVVSYMSQTIDDFRDFFKPKSAKDKVFICDLIQKSIEFVKPQLIQNSIQVEFEHQNNIELELHSSEFMQVILNIINNAKDALISNISDFNNRKIFITLDKVTDKLILSIKDNAGGIPQEYINKIFEPYFSTKSKNGTGLGLYISKIIVQEHLNGELSVQNSDIGAEFIIYIPLS